MGRLSIERYNYHLPRLLKYMFCNLHQVPMCSESEYIAKSILAGQYFCCVVSNNSMIYVVVHLVLAAPAERQRELSNAELSVVRLSVRANICELGALSKSIRTP